MTEQDTKDRNLGCLILLGIGVLIGLYSIISDGGKNTGNNYSPTYNTPAPRKEWYEGGTLHKSKIYEWKTATEENKLATCADFITGTKKKISLEDSYSLKKCIDEAVKGHTKVDNSDVSEIAAMCLILMENQ